MAPFIRFSIAAGLSIVASVAVARADGQCPTKECDPALLVHRTLTAARIDDRRAPVIDGRLDETIWSEADVAINFVESTPRPAALASLRSEARVLADAHALYVALTYYDPQPSGIRGPLARRDDETTSDWAFVEIDSRYERRMAYSFGVNPRGVQVDGLYLSDTDYDISWNAVWESAAQVTNDGWTIEFRIPFSQIAFRLPASAGKEGKAAKEVEEEEEDNDVRAASGEMTWGINFYRNSPAHGESSNWSPRYRGLGGVVAHFNDLRVPAPPRVRRLDVTPYVAPRVGSANDTIDSSNGSVSTSMKAGADFSLGLGSNFNLTGTVLPDFGQVEADPSQVNLSAFELFQPEQRPFFLEGLDVFRFSTSLPFTSRDVSFAYESPFYSRRVGRAPRGDAPEGSTFASRPIASTVLGAAKLSGQTAHGWTLGLFTALTDREDATLRETTSAKTGAAGNIDSALDAGPGPSDRVTSRQRWPVESRSLVTVGRAVKNLNRGDSSVGVFIADLHRFDEEPGLSRQQVREALTMGVDADHRFGDRRYEWRSWLLASRIAGDREAIARVAEAPHHYFQRPDAPRLHDEPYGTSLAGIAAETRISRISGAFRWDVTGHIVSPGFDANEIGFQRSADWLLAAGTWKYEKIRPGRLVRAWAIGSDNAGLGWSWGGERRAATINGYASIDWRNYWNVKVTATHDAPILSTDRLRGGPALLLPPSDGLALTLRTDQRRASFLSLDARASREPASGSSAMSVAPLLNIRSSDYVQWSIGPTWQLDTIGWQYAGTLSSGDAQYLVGRVTQRTVAVTGRADLTFSPRLVLQIYAQPFGTIGRFDRFQRLVAARAADPAQRFAPIDPAETRLASPDLQERSLNGSVVLRWEYRPGSFFTAVWNQRRDAAASDISRSSANAFAASFRDPATNVVILKWSMRLGA
jgi:hypothetical protein